MVETAPNNGQRQKRRSSLQNSDKICTCAANRHADAVAKEKTYDCVVIGGGIRIPPKSLTLFEMVVNAVYKAAPAAKIAFNTRPEDTAEAAARQLIANQWQASAMA